MKKDPKNKVRTGLSGPIETIMRNGLDLKSDVRVCLSVTVPYKRCKNGCSYEPCVHVCAVLYRIGHTPFLIENRGVTNQPELTLGICIRRPSLPKKQSLDPGICFDFLHLSTELDPICTFLAHLLAEDAYVEFTECERPSYACVELTLFKNHFPESSIHTVRNYWIPTMFRQNQEILTP